MLTNPPAKDADLFEELWARNTHDDLLLARHQQIPLAKATRLQRARAQGFNVDTAFYHVTTSHFQSYATGIASKHYTLFEHYDVLTQGMFFSTSRLKPDVGTKPAGQYFLRPGKVLCPLTSIPSGTTEHESAIEAYGYIFSPLVTLNKSELTISFAGFSQSISTRNDSNWVREFASTPIHWGAFDHPEVIDRMRELGFESAIVREPALDDNHAIFVLDPVNIRRTDAAFHSERTLNPYLLAQRGIPMSTESAAIATSQQSVFHGSPFMFDRFSLESVSNEEQLHPFGWGLYFSQEKQVAEWYRSAQAPAREAPVVYINGNRSAVQAIQDAAHAIAQVQDSVSRTDLANHFKAAAEQYEADPPSYLTAEGVRREITYSRYYERVLNNANDVSITVSDKPGKVYAAVIPSDERLLLWDKPLAQQPAALLDLLTNARGVMNADKAMTGGEAYKKLSQALGGDQQASLVLAKSGIPGLKYLNLSSDGPDYGSYNFVIWDEDAISLHDVNAQVGQSKQLAKARQENRATISFSSRTFASIVLGEKSDATSLVHEGAHLFLEMYTDAAAKSWANDELKHDYEVMLQWFGIHDVTWRSMSIDERMPFHEQFAESFEVYLLTNESPIPNTHGEYQDWLSDIREDFLIAHPDTTLPPDVKQLFDRMLDATATHSDQSVTRPIFESVYAASLASGQTDRVATIQASIFSSAFARLHANCGISAFEFLTRYDLSITTEKNPTLKSGELAQRVYGSSTEHFAQFNLPSHVGTPTGTLPYGWGAYFDSNRSVAEFYRNSIRKLQLPADTAIEALRMVGIRMNQVDIVKFIEYANQLNNEYDTAVNLALRLQYCAPNLVKHDTHKLAKAFVNFNQLVLGHIYQVDVPENDDLLNWDAPLNQQHALLQEKLQHAGLFRLLTNDAEKSMLTGGDLYRVFSDYFAKHSQIMDRDNLEALASRKTAAYFASIGIPGVQYMTADKPSHRAFVIWDERLINIEAIDDHLCAQSPLREADLTHLDESLGEEFTQTPNHRI